MSELILQWSIVAALLVSLAVQISDYKRRKAVSASIKDLQALIKGEQK